MVVRVVLVRMCSMFGLMEVMWWLFDLQDLSGCLGAVLGLSSFKGLAF